MNGKSANGTAGGMACIEGLPPLPKSLSGLLNSSGGSWREMERMYVKKTMIQDDLSRGRNNTDSLLASKPANLDAALALLRKEMVTFSGSGYADFIYISLPFQHLWETILPVTYNNNIRNKYLLFILAQFYLSDQYGKRTNNLTNKVHK
uniref:Protein FAM89A n=1 Tax=Xiphophorus couchianus TaxID=32473 RepID=A0A3B5MYN1_9TELE